MFDNNGREPILSETEIRFLLSDQPVPVKRTPSPSEEKTRGAAKGTEKETIVNDLFATIREPR
jgi:hypothetical protein